jgi:hypothetical protein
MRPSGRATRHGRMIPLPLVDSNHHSRLQRPLSCRWTKGQQSTLSYRHSGGCSIGLAITLSASASSHSTSSTAATRVTVRVGTTVPGSASASATVSEKSGTTPNNVDPEPLIPAMVAPAARSCAMVLATSG